MKKLILILLFISKGKPMFSQDIKDCLETKSIVLSGEIYDYELENCVSTVEITTLDQDTTISGISFIDAVESVKIIPTEDYTINIKPGNANDLIDLFAIDRTERGGATLEDKGMAIINIYPNPATTTLSIETELNILSFKIENIYGVTSLQGNNSDGLINVSTLPNGLYYITIQTTSTILRKTFYKN